MYCNSVGGNGKEGSLLFGPVVCDSDDVSVSAEGRRGCSVGAVAVREDIGSSKLVACLDNGWVVTADVDRSEALARSAIVSVAVQKAGGEFFQPIRRTKGNATRFSAVADGKVTPSLGMSSMLRHRR